MNSTRQQVICYLAHMKLCAAQDFTILPRAKNSDFLFGFGISFEVARDVVLQMKPADYVEGPVRDDKDLLRDDVWVFGKTLSWEDGSVDAYIKLMVKDDPSGRRCVCVSFHEAEFPLRYVFGGEQREAYLLPEM